MSKRSLQKLIKNEKNEEKILEAFKKWFKEGPELFEVSCILDTLIDKNKIHILNKFEMDEQGNHLLYFALSKGLKGEEVFIKLLTYFVEEVNHQNHHGDTLLHLAIKEQQFWAIFYLCKIKGISCFIPNNEGKTVLILSEPYPEIRSKFNHLVVKSQPLDLSEVELERSILSYRRTRHASLLSSRKLRGSMLSSFFSSNDVVSNYSESSTQRSVRVEDSLDVLFKLKSYGYS